MGLHYRECIGGATLIGLNWWGCMELHCTGCIIGGATMMRWGCIGLHYKGYIGGDGYTDVMGLHGATLRGLH